MGYEYEIFVSYRRSVTIGTWVKEHLVPLLEARLCEVAEADIRLSCDYRMATGTRWPEELKHRIAASKVLLAIWSADYFRSDWCMAEWQSFRRREEVLGLFTASRTDGLVYPIRYADGEYFHPEAKNAQWKDLASLNYPHEAFRLSAKYLDFDEAVQEIAQELVQMLGRVPPWVPDFPIVEPRPLDPTAFPRPVL